MSMLFWRVHSSLPSAADQTPTPTRFLKNCEEVGLFNELTSPFDHDFKRAAEDDIKKVVLIKLGRECPDLCLFYYSSVLCWCPSLLFRSYRWICHHWRHLLYAANQREPLIQRHTVLVHSLILNRQQVTIRYGLFLKKKKAETFADKSQTFLFLSAWKLEQRCTKDDQSHNWLIDFLSNHFLFYY